MARDHGTRLRCGQGERVHRGVHPGCIARREMRLDGVSGISHLPGADRARGAFERVGGVDPARDVGFGVDRAQMANTLLREQCEKLALQGLIAAGLAGKIGEIDGGLGHFWLGGMTLRQGSTRRFDAPASAVMVNEALTTFVNPATKWVPMT
jgi:hypothetical protein